MKRKQYTADEFRQIKERLQVHSTILVATLRAMVAGEIDFEKACLVRNDAQCLVSTLLALRNIDLSIVLAADGPRYPGFDIEACGLEQPCE